MSLNLSYNVGIGTGTTYGSPEGDLGGSWLAPTVETVNAQAVGFDYNSFRVGFRQLIEAFALYVFTEVPTGAVSDTSAIAFNIAGSPGTALAPGTLIYKTTNSGTTWTAIL